MAIEELSLIRFNCSNFFAVLLNSRPFQPISTLLIKLVGALIESESEPDEEHKEKLKWIYENTHEKVKQNLPIIELAVFKNLDRGLNREIEVGENTYTLTELYKYLDEISLNLSKMVISIAKKYSIDIPIQNFGRIGDNQTINMN